MITTYGINEKGEFIKDISPEMYKSFTDNNKARLWIDIKKPSQKELEIISDHFNFHPLSIEDISKEIELPKIDNFEDYIFVVLHRIIFDIKNEYISTQETDFFLGKNYIISIHKQESKSVIDMIEKVNNNPIILKNGPDFIMHGIIDTIVDNYFPILDYLEDRIDILEETILDGKTNKVLNEILKIKKDLSMLRKSIGPQRDVINKLARKDYKQISDKAVIYYRDVYDHLLRIHSSVESLNDLLSIALNAYTSVESNKLNITSYNLNVIMQKLALISTIFLPLTFIASFYGMNFKFMFPPLDQLGSFYITVGFMLFLSLFMYLIFRRKKLL
jgi:magnesium transporter